MIPAIQDDGTIQLGRVPSRATFRLSLDVLHEDGAPFDLSGSAIRMEFRTSSDASPALVLTTEDGDIGIVALSGQIDVVAQPSRLEPLCGYFVWGLLVRDGAGDVPISLEGDVDFYRPPADLP